MGIRDDNRTEVTAKILRAARDEIRERSGVGLSMRAVAREVGMASSAVYRYFPTREHLITAMIVESYGHLEEALTSHYGWAPLARAFRDWAREHVHEFQLIYGTPIPGYVAPPETVPAAAAVARHFLVAGAGRDVPCFDDPLLTAQLASLDDAPSPSGAAAVLAELAALVGFVTLEVAGHFVGTADPADHLFEALLRRQQLTLSGAAPR